MKQALRTQPWTLTVSLTLAALNLKKAQKTNTLEDQLSDEQIASCETRTRNIQIKSLTR